MFQNFHSPEKTGSNKKRIADLRKQMAKENIDWYLVPHADEYQNEYLPECAERLAWLTGFTGSAGFAVIGMKTSHLFVDGRYTVQAADQTNNSLFEIHDLIEAPPIKFIKTVIKTGQCIAYDPALITICQIQNWKNTGEKTGAILQPIDNLIDRIWLDQPDAPVGNIALHPIEYAGESAERKLAKIRDKNTEDDADFLITNDPASLAWIFNIRGSDVAHNPVPLGSAIISAAADEKPMLFIDKRKLDKKTKTALGEIAAIFEPDRLERKLGAISRKAKIHCDPNMVSTLLGSVIEKRKGTLIKKRSPVILLRAIKNEIELDGSQKAHLRDGVACTKFFYWLDNQKPGSIDEITAAKKLEEFRINTAKVMNSELVEISFDTISAAGPNGAIVHYRVNESTNRILENNSLYLVDSGGQYRDGTTDITRTISIGVPSDEVVTDNTLVLKGHIAIALARFPEGTRGVDIDVLARNALWQHGKDYAHGTGHGIGSYLNVHEGPQSISKRGMEPLKSGMIISNEPGYYREGHYGIRIENLVIVRGPEAVEGGKPMLGFETITLCPIDNRLINPVMMNDDELHWLNAYHGHVRRTLSPHLDQQEQEWLIEATRPLFRELPAASA